VRAASSPAEREQRADRGGGVVGVCEAEGMANYSVDSEHNHRE